MSNESYRKSTIFNQESCYTTRTVHDDNRLDVAFADVARKENIPGVGKLQCK